MCRSSQIGCANSVATAWACFTFKAHARIALPNKNQLNQHSPIEKLPPSATDNNVVMKLTAEQTEDLPFPVGCEYIIMMVGG